VRLQGRTCCPFHFPALLDVAARAASPSVILKTHLIHPLLWHPPHYHPHPIRTQTPK
jgi:hypothetical protein